eukprot:5022313-Pleurochrysis_carterae.AAC.1
MLFACTRPARSARAPGATTLTSYFCNEVFSMLEENDRMEGKNAINAERRALRTKTVVAGDDVTSQRDELRQLREQMAAMTTIKSAMRTTTNGKPYDECKVPHRGEYYGEAIATGNLTMKQAAEKFIFITDPARRPAAAAEAFKRYQDYQVQKGGGNPKAVKLERMCAMTKLVTCYNVDLRPTTSPGFAQGNGHVVLRMDSKFDQHKFNDMRWFPFGVTPEPNVLVKTAEKGVPAIVPRGKGNAMQLQTAARSSSSPTRC